MISRFIKVTNNIYRGSAPSVEDVKMLHRDLNIKKIISLDAAAGLRINRICKLLNIQHIIIPINLADMTAIAHLLSYNLYDLLNDGGPTFVHCLHGKDRTGMVIAMFKCQYMDWSCHDAIAEAKKLGFGVGLNPKVTKFYEKVICKSCEDKHDHANIQHIDKSNADIAENSREDNVTVFEGAPKSFAPYLTETRQYPYDSVYDYAYDQYPTRNNVELKQNVNENEPSQGDSAPLVGLYDNDSGIKGVGPVENGGGFVNT